MMIWCIVSLLIQSQVKSLLTIRRSFRCEGILKTTSSKYLLSYFCKDDSRHRQVFGGSLPSDVESTVGFSEFDVYIENTDAFGMLNNGNIPVMFERTLSKTLLSNSGRMIGFKVLKYTKPARLGERLIVHSKPSKKSNNGFTLTVKLSSSNNEEYEEGQKNDTSSGTSIASATGVKFKKEVNLKDEDFSLQSSSIPLNFNDGKVFKSTFRLWADELGVPSSVTDAHGSNQLVMYLPTRTVFNLLERGRSDMLGGPAVLASSAASSVHYYGRLIYWYDWIVVYK